LGTLADSLSKTLKTYTPEAGIALNWIAGAGIEIPMPKADVRLTEDGNESPVNRTGHGLQRALVLTLLQHLAVARGVEPEKKDGQEPPASGENLAAATMPDLLLAIEEPELYQHPNRQRHFAQVLMDLATGDIPGVAQRTQVLYCTHSPLFVGIDRLNQLRLLRKQSADASKPKTTKLIQASLDQVADELWVAQGKPGEQWTGETLRPRLQAIMTPWMNEGFFADVVVLVEGEEDRAAILAQAASAGLQLEREGIAVIPCMGKNSIDRPLLIFRHLKIPTYVVWDADYTPKNPDPKANRSLFRLLSHPVEDWPTQNIVTDRFACFRENLDEALRDEGEIGRTLFDDLLRDICDDLEITRQADGRKNPFVMKRLILRASGQGRKSKTLEQIVSKIRLLKGPEPRAS
jgi:hypothetical protein